MKVFSFLIAVLTFYSCTTSSVSDLNWMEGQYTRTFGTTTQHETWQIIGDTLFGISSFTAEDKALTEMQEVKIYSGANNLQLELRGEGSPFALNYELVAITGNSMQFKNVQPIFPEVLNYVVANDTLKILQIGQTQGMKNQVEFSYTRVN